MIWPLNYAKFFFYKKFKKLNMYIFVNFCRWFSEKVSSLELCAPLTISPDLSVGQTIEIMNSEGYDQLPVINSEGYSNLKKNFF